MFVSIIIPAYKKEATIKKNIKSILKTMDETRYKYEVIVVVDGKVDKTFEEVKKLKDPKVKVFALEENIGKGYAVRYGMARSKGDTIVFIDAGLDINVNGISIVLEHMQWYKADIIVASKRHPVSKVRYPLLRRLYSMGYQFLVYALFWLKVKDTQTGLKVFRRSVLEKVLPRLIVKRYAFDIELLAVANYLGFNRIYEAPVEITWDFEDTGFKKFLFLDPQIRNIFIDTLAVYYRMYILNYYHDSNAKNWPVGSELKLKPAPS